MTQRKLNHDANYMSVEKNTLIEEITQKNAKLNQILRERELIQGKNSQKINILQKQLENSMIQTEKLYSQKIQQQ